MSKLKPTVNIKVLETGLNKKLQFKTTDNIDNALKQIDIYLKLNLNSLNKEFKVCLEFKNNQNYITIYLEGIKENESLHYKKSDILKNKLLEVEDIILKNYYCNNLERLLD